MQNILLNCKQTCGTLSCPILYKIYNTLLMPGKLPFVLKETFYTIKNIFLWGRVVIFEKFTGKILKTKVVAEVVKHNFKDVSAIFSAYKHYSLYWYKI